MGKYQLGEFEEVVMLVTAILHENAYGVSIKKEIETRMNRGVSVGALQSALRRLEDKGYLKSTDKEGTQVRAGRPKRFYQLTTLGRQALQYTRETRNSLWEAIPSVSWDLNMIKTSNG